MGNTMWNLYDSGKFCTNPAISQWISFLFSDIACVFFLNAPIAVYMVI